MDEQTLQHLTVEFTSHKLLLHLKLLLHFSWFGQFLLFFTLVQQGKKGKFLPKIKM